MAKEMSTIAFFRSRGNDKAPLFEAKYAHDVEAMRKHADFFECDAEGNALDGRSVSEPKRATEVEEEIEAVVVPAGTANPGAFAPIVRVNGQVGGKAKVSRRR